MVVEGDAAAIEAVVREDVLRGQFARVVLCERGLAGEVRITAEELCDLYAREGDGGAWVDHAGVIKVRAAACGAGAAA